MGDFGSFVARWGDKCFMLRWGVWSWDGKCFIAPLGVSCWGVVSIKPVMVLGLVREKVRPARLVARGSGRKFTLHAQNAPNWAILCEQGEFCPASGAM